MCMVSASVSSITQRRLALVNMSNIVLLYASVFDICNDIYLYIYIYILKGDGAWMIVFAIYLNECTSILN